MFIVGLGYTTPDFLYFFLSLCVSVSLFLAVRLYHPSPLDYIFGPNRDVADSFSLEVQCLHVRVKGFIRKRHSRVRSYSSNRVKHVFPTYLDAIRGGGR